MQSNQDQLSNIVIAFVLNMLSFSHTHISDGERSTNGTSNKATRAIGVEETETGARIGGHTEAIGIDSANCGAGRCSIDANHCRSK